jgi:hypothetical protein
LDVQPCLHQTLRAKVLLPVSANPNHAAAGSAVAACRAPGNIVVLARGIVYSPGKPQHIQPTHSSVSYGKRGAGGACSKSAHRPMDMRGVTTSAGVTGTAFSLPAISAAEVGTDRNLAGMLETDCRPGNWPLLYRNAPEQGEDKDKPFEARTGRPEPSRLASCSGSAQFA